MSSVTAAKKQFLADLMSLDNCFLSLIFAPGKISRNKRDSSSNVFAIASLCCNSSYNGHVNDGN